MLHHASLAKRCITKSLSRTTCLPGHIRRASTLSGVHRGLRGEEAASRRPRRPQRQHDWNRRGRVGRNTKLSENAEIRKNEVWESATTAQSRRGTSSPNSFGHGEEQDTRDNPGHDVRERGFSAERGLSRDWPRAREDTRERMPPRGFSAFEKKREERQDERRPKSNSPLITDYDQSSKAKVDLSLPTWTRIPYTTAASQFLYGHSVVMAALRANRRKLYKLYIHRSGGELIQQGIDLQDRVKKYALLAGVRVKEMGPEFLPMMDKLSGGRKHQNCILEASPLPIVPITSLGDSSLNGNFEIEVADQSQEDQAINKAQQGKNTVEYTSDGWRHPFLLFIDGVTDEGNLGAILRSAYLLGVDGVIIDPRRSAPMSSITLKASSGAAEAVPIYSVSEPLGFLKRSRQRGWKVYATDAVDYTESTNIPKVVFQQNRPYKIIRDHAPLAKTPAILVLGNEEQGVSKKIKALAEYSVGVTAARDPGDIDLDSLNVSVAAALLSMYFLTKPQVSPKDAKADSSEPKLF